MTQLSEAHATRGSAAGRSAATDRESRVPARGATARIRAVVARKRIEAPALGVLAAILVFLGSWTPSVWYDEAATIVSATRSWPELWAMLHTVDAVHGVYYAFMHVWFDIVGYSPLTLRLPSAVAVGVTVALTVLLASRLGSRRLGVLAGVVLCTVPRFTWSGTEGRSYAITGMLAVAVTLLLMRALEDRPATSRWRGALPWLAYGVLALFSIGVFVYLALLLVAHAATVALLRSARSVTPRAAISFVATVVATGLVSIPFVMAVRAQSGQVGWLDPIGPGIVNSVLVTQLSPLNLPFAVVAWLLFAAGVLLLLLTRRRGGDRRGRVIAAWALPWIVVPTALLLAVTAVMTPLYSPRYLTFVAPAFAISIAAALIGLGKAALALSVRGSRAPRKFAARTPWVGAVAAAGVAGLAILSCSSYLAQRSPEAKQNSSWAQAAARVQTLAESLDDERPAVVFGSVARHPTATARVVEYAYPDAFEGLTDVALTEPIGATDRLWETARPVDTAMLADHRAVILLTSGRESDLNRAAIEAAGFRQTFYWHYTNLDLRLYER